MPSCDSPSTSITSPRSARRARRASQSRLPRPLIAELAGAQGITVHLRARPPAHHRPRCGAAAADVATKLNIEMAATVRDGAIAAPVRPDQVTLVPERPRELTTEGGLDVVADTGGRLPTSSGRCATPASASASFSIRTMKQVRAAKASGRRRHRDQHRPSTPMLDARRGTSGAGAHLTRLRRSAPRADSRFSPATAELRERRADRRDPADRGAQHRAQHRRARGARRAWIARFATWSRFCASDGARLGDDGVEHGVACHRARIASVARCSATAVDARHATQRVTLRTDDGVTLAGDVVRARLAPAPAVILVHMLQRSRRDWDALAHAARRRGHRRAGDRSARPRRVAGQSVRRTRITRRWSHDVQGRAPLSRVARRRAAVARRHRRRVARRQPRRAGGGRRPGDRQPGAAVAVARLPRPAHRSRDAQVRRRPVLLVASDDDAYATRSARSCRRPAAARASCCILERRRPRHGDARPRSRPRGRWWTGSAGRCYDRSCPRRSF